MGWLFAVSLGLQKRSAGQVYLALIPIACGHALALLSIALLVVGSSAFVPLFWLRSTAALILFAFGLIRLWRVRHPNWVGMKVNFADLTFWSWLMATAHGAGLMLIPVVLGVAAQCGAVSGASSLGTLAGPVAARTAILLGVHTGSHLLISALLAAAVYHLLGLRILRLAWFNTDLIWSISLLVTGAVLLVM